MLLASPIDDVRIPTDGVPCAPKPDTNVGAFDTKICEVVPRLSPRNKNEPTPADLLRFVRVRAAVEPVPGVTVKVLRKFVVEFSAVTEPIVSVVGVAAKPTNRISLLFKLNADESEIRFPFDTVELLIITLPATNV